MSTSFPIKDNKPQIKTVWKLLFAVIVWGLSFIATKNALVEVRPVVIVFLRQLLGILFLAFVILKQKKSFAVDLRKEKWIFALAAIACFHLWIQVT